jgi:hypothetical protein
VLALQTVVVTRTNSRRDTHGQVVGTTTIPPDSNKPSQSCEYLRKHGVALSMAGARVHELQQQELHTRVIVVEVASGRTIHEGSFL